MEVLCGLLFHCRRMVHKTAGSVHMKGKGDSEVTHDTAGDTNGTDQPVIKDSNTGTASIPVPSQSQNQQSRHSAAGSASSTAVASSHTSALLSPSEDSNRNLREPLLED